MLERPGVLHIEARIAEVVLLRSGSVVGQHLRGYREGLMAGTTIEDGVDSLIDLVDIRVVAFAPLESKLEIVAAVQVALRPRAASGPFKHPCRIFKLVGCRTCFGISRNILEIEGRACETGLIAKREEELAPADAEIEQEIIGDLAGPESLKNVGRLDLPPTGILGNKCILRVAAEETILFVVQPDEAELVLGIDLPVAAQVGIRLVVDVHYGITRLIRHRKDSLRQMVPALGAEQPPTISQKGTAKTGRGVEGHIKR